MKLWLRRVESPGRSGDVMDVYPGQKSTYVPSSATLSLSSSLQMVAQTDMPTTGNAEKVTECELFLASPPEPLSSGTSGIPHSSNGCGLKPSLLEVFILLFCFVGRCLSVSHLAPKARCLFTGQQPLLPLLFIHSHPVTGGSVGCLSVE